MFGTVLSTKLKNVVSILVGSRVCTRWRRSEGVVVNAIEDFWDLWPKGPLKLVFQTAHARPAMARYTSGDPVVSGFLQAHQRSSDHFGW